MFSLNRTFAVVKEKLWNGNYWKVMIANFTLFFAFYLLTPLLPLYLSEHFHATKDVIGVVLSGYTVMALLSRPFSGYLVDTFDRKKVLMLDEDSIQNKYALSECCKPIPGDPVMGYIDDNNHVVIHKLQCPVAARLKANHGNRVLAAEWSKKMSTMLFPVTIFMRALDHMGLLNEITQVISQEMSVNMHKLTVEVKDGIFECTVQLFVHNTNEADDLLKHLQALKSLDSVSRI